jgi:hypothetical protein
VLNKLRRFYVFAPGDRQYGILLRHDDAVLLSAPSAVNPFKAPDGSHVRDITGHRRFKPALRFFLPGFGKSLRSNTLPGKAAQRAIASVVMHPQPPILIPLGSLHSAFRSPAAQQSDCK